ncbi:hypothetical protein QWY28_07950 [Nocardioides sp. SOB77]|uniref:Uncharacterized protein n=1 Tax=Nocardioides oceani TaxID=3058369 RepID=A0ABT8FDV7_9ACTN|nr:hypothetical protein [Nocardioides oceani]MDN4172867.1 hypothetical protein [Nocardioides oceani]
MDTEERPGEPTAEDGAAAGEDDRRDWWHRDHPVFTPLSGFFTGLVAVTLLPGVYAAVLGALFSVGTAEDLFPYVLVVLAVPLALLVVPRTRRFGRYMLLGMVLTAVVVGGVAALVLWAMVRTQS